VSGIVGLSMRLPPANLEAEQALLGALLANNKAYERVAEFLRPEHFADACHARVYAAIQRRIEAGQLADAVTLRADFENNGGLDEAGGVGYLAQLLRAMVGIINAGEYGRVVEDHWLRRRLIEFGETTVNRAFGHEPELTARQIAEAADTELLSIASAKAGGGARDGQAVMSSLMNDVAAAMQRRGGLAGVTWGFRGLDRMTGGLRPGQFVLLGARPSMGKTSLALRIILQAARAGHRVLFVSAEMRAEAVAARAVAAAAGVPMSAVTRGGVEEGGAWRPLDANSFEMAEMKRAALEIGSLPIMWDDDAFTVAAIRARARRMQREPGGLSLVVVDYLGRIRPTAEAMRQGSVAGVTELSAGFKDLAMQLGVPVVLLSQLNRQVEAREDKTPVMSDLRDSGALEQDADIVLFLYRAHYYLTRNEPRRRPTEKVTDFEQRFREWDEAVDRERGRGTIIVAKQRQGPIGPVRVRFDDSTAQFSDEPQQAGGD
jgi:replicative DNA helicase